MSLLLGEGFEQASKDWEYAPKQTGEKSGSQSEILEQFLFWKNSFRGKVSMEVRDLTQGAESPAHDWLVSSWQIQASNARVCLSEGVMLLGSILDL